MHRPSPHPVRLRRGARHPAGVGRRAAVMPTHATTPVPDITEEEDAALWALCFRALGDATRLRILALVVRQPFSVEPGVIVYRPGLEAPVASYHLRLPADAGFIESRPSGSFVCWAGGHPAHAPDG